jgi:protein-tyrosine-phosphatase
MTELTASDPYRVLFLCTHNSSHSQMAEDCCGRREGRATRRSAQVHIRAAYIRWL